MNSSIFIFLYSGGKTPATSGKISSTGVMEIKSVLLLQTPEEYTEELPNPIGVQAGAWHSRIARAVAWLGKPHPKQHVQKWESNGCFFPFSSPQVCGNQETISVDKIEKRGSHSAPVSWIAAFLPVLRGVPFSCMEEVLQVGEIHVPHLWHTSRWN